MPFSTLIENDRYKNANLIIKADVKRICVQWNISFCSDDSAQSLTSLKQCATGTGSESGGPRAFWWNWMNSSALVSRSLSLNKFLMFMLSGHVVHEHDQPKSERCFTQFRFVWIKIVYSILGLNALLLLCFKVFSETIKICFCSSIILQNLMMYF